ncbi:MAG: TVP38/TMEM64 family protein [Bacillota bacterium]|nr:TVP38/TMEM64 family protein [Bacillota bacterium]
MEQRKKDEYRNKYKVISSVIKLALLAFILIAVPAYIYFFHHELLEDMANLRNIEAWLLQYKAQSALVYIAAQIIQIIICIIPGQALQIAAGYLYGFWLAYLLSLVGALLGSVAVFYIARILGHDALHILFGERKITEMLDNMNSKRGMIIVFIIFLIPGIPKDLCSYAAGLSKIHLKPYLIISLIARSPGMMCSIAIGKQVMDGQYTSAIVIAAIVAILFVIGLIFKDKVIHILDKAYDKLIGM